MPEGLKPVEIGNPKAFGDCLFICGEKALDNEQLDEAARDQTSGGVEWNPAGALRNRAYEYMLAHPKEFEQPYIAEPNSTVDRVRSKVERFVEENRGVGAWWAG